MRRKLLGALTAVSILAGTVGMNMTTGMAASTVLSHIEVIYRGSVVTSGGCLEEDDFKVKAYYRDGGKNIGRIVRVEEVEDFQILEYTLTSGANTITVSYTENGTTVVGRCTVPASESAPGWIHDKTADLWKYRLGIDGLAKEEWVFVDENWYYLNSEGIMLTGWQEIGENWYYLYGDGSCAINTLTPDGFRVDANGVWMQNEPGWIYDETADVWRYRLGVVGMAAEQWVFVDENWYYLDSEGIMLTGWQEIGENWYYLYEDGSCAINTLTPDGFRVDENGIWMQ